MTTKVGILCAGDREVAPFLPWIEARTISEKAMLKFHGGKIEGVSVVAVFSGVCKTNAAIAAQILIDTYGCTAMINAGTCGGMDKDVKLFDTIISTETAYWDVAEGVLTKFHPWMETVYFKADEGLLRLAKRTVLNNPTFEKVLFGRMITGEAFIEDNYRDEINEKYAPLCVDMETASVAHVCYANKIPCIAVRTITDTAEHIGANAFEQNCDKASGLSACFVASMLKEMLTDWRAV